MGDWHRLSSYSKLRIPRQKRTIRVYGEGEDTGKWFRCWNCGFVCNVERDALDQTEYGRDGISYANYSVTAEGPIFSTEETIFVLDGIFTFDTGAVQYPVVNRGCPLCGSLNWK